MWTPASETLNTLAVLFQQSNNGSRDQRQQRIEARRQVEAARQQPDLAQYLVYLLVERPPQLPPTATEAVRATAGLWLKNILIFDWPRLPAPAVAYVQQMVTRGLADPNQLVRNASSIVVTTLISKAGLQGWPQLLPELVQAIDSSSAGDPVQEGAISALAKVCEDSAGQVAQNEALLAQLVPKLIAFCESPSPRVRSQAVFCLTQFVPLGAQGFLVHIDDFMHACFALAQGDTNADTMSNICGAFSMLLLARPDKIAPHLPGVVQFCLHCLRSPEQFVALEAAEFLLALAESDADAETLAPYLPSILPAILETMVFSDEDVFVLESLAEDDSAQADRDEDIRPTLPKSRRGHGQQRDDDSDDEDDDFESSLENWNLRKCSAATLDQFAQKEPATTLSIVLPHLLERIAPQQSWPVRESAVLAFGAIAQGCVAANEVAFVPELGPFLLDLLHNEHASIREISCWTLSRYAAPESLDGPVLEGVLKCMLDVNKRVQSSACAALSTLAEAAGPALEPYAAELFAHLRSCFAKYQANNMLSLYECVQSVATAVEGAVQQQPDLVKVLMEPLLQRWRAVADDDRELLAMLECLSFLAMATGPPFAEHAPPIFERSVLLARESLVLLERAKLDPLSVDAPEPVVVVCALDMVDGLVQALHSEGMAPLFAAQEQSTQMTIVDLLRSGIATGDLEIRQSALALVGDLAIYCFDAQLLPQLSALVPELVEQVDVREIEDNIMYEPVGDNAMWALAEIAMQHDQFSLEPWFNDLFQRLGTVLCSPAVLSPTLLSNAATAIGRLGLGLSQLVAPHLRIFIGKWLEVIMDVDSTLEKDTALQGICLVIAANPSALEAADLQQFLKVLAAHFTATPPLKELVTKVLEGYKNYLPTFADVVESLPLEFKQQLQAMYSI